MGIDISKMRAKLAALNNKGGNSNLFWKPQDGEQTIRIVSPLTAIPSRTTGSTITWGTIVVS